MKKLFGFFILVFVLTGCETTQTSRVPNISYWQHYQHCANSYTDIRQIAQCGKASRNNYIYQYNLNGSSDGNMYAVYLDTLAEQVNEGSMTNSAAKMQWVQTTQNVINAYRQALAQAQTADAINRGVAQQRSGTLIQQGMGMVTGKCSFGVNC